MLYVPCSRIHIGDIDPRVYCCIFEGEGAVGFLVEQRAVARLLAAHVEIKAAVAVVVAPACTARLGRHVGPAHAGGAELVLEFAPAAAVGHVLPQPVGAEVVHALEQVRVAVAVVVAPREAARDVSVAAAVGGARRVRAPGHAKRSGDLVEALEICRSLMGEQQQDGQGREGRLERRHEHHLSGARASRR